MCENCQLCVWRSSDESNPRGREGAKGESLVPARFPSAVATTAYPRKSFTGREFMSMHKSKLLEDCLWAMVPLQIPSVEALESVSGRVNDRLALLQPSSWLYSIAGGRGGE